MKKCIYCDVDIDSKSVVDICQSCMYQVWGKKMSETIVSSMERERANGNLELWDNENKADVVEKKIEIEEVKIVEETPSLNELEVVEKPRMDGFEGMEIEEIEINEN